MNNDQHSPGFGSPDELDVDSFGNAWPAGESRVEFLERVDARSDTVDESTLRRIAKRLGKHFGR